MMRDLTIGLADEIKPLLGVDRSLTVEGSFPYQACDDRVCYPPQTMPLEWVFQLERHDAERAPASLRRSGWPP